jgi:hypothetical protein
MTVIVVTQTAPESLVAQGLCICQSRMIDCMKRVNAAPHL